MKLLPAFLFAFALATTALAATPKPLKIFILAGQSNMEGHAKEETFDYIGDDPSTAPLLQQMRGTDGKPRVCDHVWISYFTGEGEKNGEGTGKLTAGYGSRQNPAVDGGNIGPEFTFGLTMDRKLAEPVLIIKTAWGGKSLFYDFRSPSAGPYVRTAADNEKGRYPDAECGRYYKLMIEHVKHVLGDIKRVCPAYDPKQGFELAGFVWLQGWNDMINRDVYPIPTKDSKEPRYSDYSRWMADFIRDVRKDFSAPRMPFVIGVMGIGGVKPNEHVAAFREAMAAPAALPEFKGNVVALQTSPFWDEKLGAIADKMDQVRQKKFILGNEVKKGTKTADQAAQEAKQFEAELISPAEQTMWKRGASNGGYHYLGCAKTFALMGNAMAETTLRLAPAPGK